MKKEQPKDERLFMRLDKDTKTLLKGTAEKQGVTVSNLINKYIDEGIMVDSRKRKETATGGAQESRELNRRNKLRREKR